ncbi:hypothetical protein [Streptomyces exfoliatus]|uniref:hypothetical protein n=1 Tax=Streptomyces exfoliatus TaxID=1905 RepID=UPI001B802443|nr:hypothetical protein [Streptomyces exfoliatus]
MIDLENESSASPGVADAARFADVWNTQLVQRTTQLCGLGPRGTWLQADEHFGS